MAESDRLTLLGERFARSAAISFLFLQDQGFIACPQSALDLEDIRDATFIRRFIRGNLAVEVMLSALTMQIMVGIIHYSSIASCDRVPQPARKIGLDTWVQNNRPVTPPPLAWMKRQTLSEELRRSHRYYAKNIEPQFEAAMEFMAQRLRSSGLLSKSDDREPT